jgi:archaellum component FlaG (FlaF/FlaG flagellin family)
MNIYLLLPTLLFLLNSFTLFAQEPADATHKKQQHKADSLKNQRKQDVWKQVETDRKAIINFAEQQHDFGQIGQGETVTYTFKYKNTGTLPLIVTNVMTTCGCTVTQWTKEPLAPNEEGEITVTFDSKGKTGMQRKVITVISNAENSKEQIVLMGSISS